MQGAGVGTGLWGELMRKVQEGDRKQVRSKLQEQCGLSREPMQRSWWSLCWKPAALGLGAVRGGGAPQAAERRMGCRGRRGAPVVLRGGGGAGGGWSLGRCCWEPGQGLVGAPAAWLVALVASSGVACGKPGLGTREAQWQELLLLDFALSWCNYGDLEL